MERAVTAANHVIQRPIGCLLGNSTILRLVSSDAAQFRDRFLIQSVHMWQTILQSDSVYMWNEQQLLHSYLPPDVKLKTISAMQQRKDCL